MVSKLGRVLAGICLVGLMTNGPIALAQSESPWADPPPDLNIGPLSPDIAPQAEPGEPDGTARNRPQVRTTRSREAPRAREARSPAAQSAKAQPNAARSIRRISSGAQVATRKQERPSVAQGREAASRPVAFRPERRRLADRPAETMRLRVARSAKYRVEYKVMRVRAIDLADGRRIRVVHIRPSPSRVRMAWASYRQSYRDCRRRLRASY